MVATGQMWFSLPPILVFFDSSASCYLIQDSSSASHSMYKRTAGISTGSLVVITYLIRMTITLHEEYQYKRFFRFRTSIRQSYSIFHIISVTTVISFIDFIELNHNVQPSLWIRWTTDPAGLAKRESSSSHASSTRRVLCYILALSIYSYVTRWLRRMSFAKYKRCKALTLPHPSV